MHKITGRENRERLVASLEETSVEQGDSQWIVTQMTVGSRVFGLGITSSLKESRDPYIPPLLSAFLPPAILALIITRLLDGHCSFVVSLSISQPH